MRVADYLERTTAYCNVLAASSALTGRTSEQVVQAVCESGPRSDYSRWFMMNYGHDLKTPAARFSGLLTVFALAAYTKHPYKCVVSVDDFSAVRDRWIDIAPHPATQFIRVQLDSAETTLSQFRQVRPSSYQFVAVYAPDQAHTDIVKQVLGELNFERCAVLVCGHPSAIEDISAMVSQRPGPTVSIKVHCGMISVYYVSCEP